MTTKEAFEKLLSTRGIYKVLGMHRGTISSMKARIKDDTYPSEEQMSKLLELAGWKVVQEKKWKEGK